MEPNLQRRIQRYGWDKAAAYYEQCWQNNLLPAQQLLLEMAALKPGEQVIDIACGTGLVTFPAAEILGKGGNMLASDISDSMVEICRQLAEEKGMQQIKVERMDAESLLVQDESFDAALCALGLMYVPSPVSALKEMHRVLKPGGRAVSAVWGQRDHCGWAEIFEIVDKRVSSEVCPMFFQMGNPGMLELAYKTAGFKEIEVKTIQASLFYSSSEEACLAAFAGGPVALAYHKFTDQVKSEAHEEYIASIEPFRTENGYGIPGEFVVAKGIK